MCAYTHVSRVTTEARRGWWMLSVSVTGGWESSGSSWKPNPGHMQEQQVLLVLNHLSGPFSGYFKCCKILKNKKPKKQNNSIFAPFYAQLQVSRETAYKQSGGSFPWPFSDCTIFVYFMSAHMIVWACICTCVLINNNMWQGVPLGHHYNDVIIVYVYIRVV